MTITQTSPGAIESATPMTGAPQGSTSTDMGHRGSDAQSPVAHVGTSSTVDPVWSDNRQKSVDGGSISETGAKHASTAKRAAPRSLFDPALYMMARQVDDLEGQRKAIDNRLRILTTVEPDDDGVMRGFGLDPSHPSVAVLVDQAEGIKALEHQAILALNRAMRKHPLAAWQKGAKGVGEKQLARLLACIGDPYINESAGTPRTVSQLWAYSGLHTLPTTGHASLGTQQGVAGGGDTLPTGAIGGTESRANPPQSEPREAARRRRGQQANWSTDAKMRAYLISTSCIKTDGEYRAVYDARRKHTASTHPDWTPGHSHNDALRIVSKRILRDLWKAARDWHMEGESDDAN